MTLTWMRKSPGILVTGVEQQQRKRVGDLIHPSPRMRQEVVPQMRAHACAEGHVGPEANTGIRVPKRIDVEGALLS